MRFIVASVIIAAACAHTRDTESPFSRSFEYPDATVVIERDDYNRGQEDIRSDEPVHSRSTRYIDRRGGIVTFEETVRFQSDTRTDAWTEHTTNAVIVIRPESMLGPKTVAVPIFVSEEYGYQMMRLTSIEIDQLVDIYFNLTDASLDSKRVRARICSDGESWLRPWDKTREAIRAIADERGTKYIRIDRIYHLKDTLERYGRALFNCPLSVDGPREQAIAKGGELVEIIANRIYPVPLPP